MSEAAGGRLLLEVRDISKRFGATQALAEVSFDIRAGEVHALTGENGAGKSTLMKIISGNYSPDSGEILVRGERQHFTGPQAAKDVGIAIIHQELNTIADMSVAENLALGREPKTVLGLLDRGALAEQARQKLARVGLDIDPRMPIGSLSVGLQQMIEIARAVSEDAQVLVLDEPTAALSQAEAEHLFGLIEQMRSDGMGLVYISHRMEEVWRLADRVSVFRDGRWVGTREKAAVRPDEIVHMMVGRPVEDLYANVHREPGEVRLAVTELTSANGAIGPVSFTVRAGEIVGMVGLVGAGRTEVARMIYGAERPASGEITVDGQRYRPRSPQRSIKSGIALLPEDRKEEALLLQMSVTDNVAISTLWKWLRGPLLMPKRVAESVAVLTQRLRVKAASGSIAVQSLSGGNQQKVVLARMLNQEPRLLILDEPTRGVDIGAKSEIYRIIDEIAHAGTAVLVISSDLPEALGLSDRLLVMRAGRIAAELAGDSATEHAVMEFATGIDADRGGDVKELV
ncbi:MAG: sugar ABC transporter ATP-binding protein [Propioniciclava sp.]